MSVSYENSVRLTVLFSVEQRPLKASQHPTNGFLTCMRIQFVPILHLLKLFRFSSVAFSISPACLQLTRKLKGKLLL